MASREVNALLDNPRWEKFCQLYAVSGNASAAYKGAGYAPKSDDVARKAASRLLTYVDIQARIQELTAEAKKAAEASAIADIVEVRQRVTQVLRGELDETKPADVLKAADLIAKLDGAYGAARVEISGSMSVEEYLRSASDDGEGQTF